MSSNVIERGAAAIANAMNADDGSSTGFQKEFVSAARTLLIDMQDEGWITPDTAIAYAEERLGIRLSRTEPADTEAGR